MPAKRALGEDVLKLTGFTGDGFHDIDFSVKKGEIVGLTGLQGSGSSEMLQAIFGSTRATAGTVTAFGKSVPHNSIHGAMRAGIAMLPNNRKENSVLPDMSLMENMAISEQTLSAAKLPVDAKRDKKRYDEYKQMLNIKAQNSTDLITSLSGGGSSVYKMDTAKASYQTLFGFGNGKIATIPTVGIVMLIMTAPY